VTEEQSYRKSNPRRTPLIFSLMSGAWLFACIMSVPDLRKTGQLAAGGVSAIGTVTEITPPAGRIGASFQYAFIANGHYYSGGGADWSATQTGTFVKARVGDSVLVSYLEKSPGTNKPGNPSASIGLAYAMVFFMFIAGLASGCVAFSLFKRLKRQR
jgi:predicted acyltransferase